MAIQQELQALNVNPHDRVNFSMQANGFAVAFQSINFTVQEFLQRSLRLDTLLQSLAEKLNSNEEFDPQGGFEILMSVVSMPRPGSRPTRWTVGRRCLDIVLTKKRCIINIKNRGQLCYARAIVTMMAHCQKDENGESKALWETLHDGRPRQTIEAKELHRQADVPEGPCGIEELTKFQTYLGRKYQIFVMCCSNPFMIIFKGPPAPYQIQLVKADNHYHGCTSWPAFVNKSYYCLDCETGYDGELVRRHSCKGRICRGCNRKNCTDYRIGTMPTTRCPVCNSLFFGEDCLLYHRSGKTCGKYRTCPMCQSEYTLNEKKRHRCGMAKCPSCEEVVQVATHKCYIQPVDVNPQREGKRKKKDPRATALFVYADIEAIIIIIYELIVRSLT